MKKSPVEKGHIKIVLKISIKRVIQNKKLLIPYTHLTQYGQSRAYIRSLDIHLVVECVVKFGLNSSLPPPPSLPLTGPPPP